MDGHTGVDGWIDGVDEFDGLDWLGLDDEWIAGKGRLSGMARNGMACGGLDWVMNGWMGKGRMSEHGMGWHGMGGIGLVKHMDEWIEGMGWTGLDGLINRWE